MSPYPATPEEAEKDVICEALTNGLTEDTGRWAYTVAGALLMLAAKDLPKEATVDNIGRVMGVLSHAFALIAKSASADMGDEPRVVLP